MFFFARSIFTTWGLVRLICLINLTLTVGFGRQFCQMSLQLRLVSNKPLIPALKSISTSALTVLCKLYCGQALKFHISCCGAGLQLCHTYWTFRWSSSATAWQWMFSASGTTCVLYGSIDSCVTTSGIMWPLCMNEQHLSVFTGVNCLVYWCLKYECAIENNYSIL